MITKQRFPGKLMGGYAGLATGSAFTVEYQGEATPHAHGFVSLANMYQHHTLEEIGKIIEANHRGVKPDDMLKRVIQSVEHLQREDRFDDDSLHSTQLIGLIWTMARTYDCINSFEHDMHYVSGCCRSTRGPAYFSFLVWVECSFLYLLIQRK